MCVGVGMWVFDTGFYGADCSLSLDSEGRPEQLTGLGYQPSPNPPRIYIYELPPAYNTWYVPHTHTHTHTLQHTIAFTHTCWACRRYFCHQ